MQFVFAKIFLLIQLHGAFCRLSGRNRHGDAICKEYFRTTMDNKTTAKPVEAQLGSTATIFCPTKIPFVLDQPDNLTVAWYKDGLGNPLTRDEMTCVVDRRYTTSKHDKNCWKFRIRYTKESDAGVYECRFTAESITRNVFFNLKIKKAYAEIIGIGGDSEKEVNVGSPLRLSCLLKGSIIEHPVYIFWYKDDRVINYDLTDGANVREGRQGSELIFPRAKLEDSGNYSCVPSNAEPASVFVFVKP